METSRRTSRTRVTASERRSGPGMIFFPACLAVLLVVAGLSLTAGRGGVRAFSLPLEAPAATPVRVPVLGSSAGILIDQATGQVLFEKNADARLANASTTKVMTAIVVMERCHLTEGVLASERACAVGESEIWLEPGETLQVEQLLYALMIQSANDAAMALAEHVGGTVEGFADIMNETAARLGCTNTHFVNPHGLDDPDHYTSARDLAIMGRHAMQNPLFRKIVTTSEYAVPWPGHEWARVAQSHNRFTKLYQYATGIKTGMTDDAGYCLVGSAAKEGRELVSVVLNAPRSADGTPGIYYESIALMEHGFNDFVQPRLTGLQAPLRLEVGDFPQASVAVSDPAQPQVLVRRDRLAGIESAQLEVNTWLPYPVEKGREVGMVVLEGANGTPITLPLTVLGEVGKPGFFGRVRGYFGSFWEGLTSPFR
ncbi:MAG: D-alanyl-D-alanine carboxypeptidase family protein [Candidatus Geothermincolia bacterium]